LAPHHNRAAFACGAPTLDTYIRRYASQDVRRRVAQVFVAVASTAESITGYYSLSAASFSREGLPPELARRLPRYPIPAAILGRLAVDRAYQGGGLGEFLLFDACARIVQASSSMAVYAVIVDAIDDRARAFYERYGFEVFPETTSRLFLPLRTLERALRSSRAK
jgi:GNAT superfamily N-acetyltransferase